MIPILNDLTGLPQEYALKYHYFIEKSDYIRFLGQNQCSQDPCMKSFACNMHVTSSYMHVYPNMPVT